MKIITILGKDILLTLILVVCFILAAFISGIYSPPPESTAASETDSLALVALLISSFMEVLILSYIIVRSRWAGWKLIIAVFLAFYGSMTFIPQIESLIYLPDKLPPDLIPKLYLMGLITTLMFSPLAVLILGRMKNGIYAVNELSRKHITKNEWIVKLTTLVVVYLVVYYSFGYFVAWKNPAVRAYYGGSDPGNFFAQLASIWNATPWMYLLQALRALLWILLVLPMVRSLQGSSWQVALVTAAFFSVWSLQLLAPNPYMPHEVANTHMIETLSSNFLFGWILGWLLSRKHESFRDLFRSDKPIP